MWIAFLVVIQTKRTSLKLTEVNEKTPSWLQWTLNKTIRTVYKCVFQLNWMGVLAELVTGSNILKS